MSFVLRNKQLLVLMIIALITFAIITYLVLGMVTHFSVFHQVTWGGGGP